MLFLNDINSALSNSPLIAQKVQGRIKYYSYENAIAETAKGALIILDPLGPNLPGEYGDDSIIMTDGLVQVDVWSRSAQDTDQVTAEALRTLFKAGYRTYGGAYNEHDRDTGIYRQAIRVRAKKYID